MASESSDARRWLGLHPRLAQAVALLVQVARDQSQQRLSLSAAAVAFWAVIAVSPVLIAISIIFSRVVDPDVLSKAVTDLQETAPASFSSLLATQLQNAADVSASTASWSLVLALITVLWATSTGVYTFLRAVRFAYGLPPQKYFSARALALGGAVIMVIVLGVLLLAVAAVSAWVASQPDPARTLLFLGEILLGTALLSGTLATVFLVATRRQRPGLAYWPGAVVGAVGTLAVFIGFGVYLNFAGSYQAIYGALASSVILSLVVYVATYVILLGAVGNARLSPGPETAP